MVERTHWVHLIVSVVWAAQCRVWSNEPECSGEWSICWTSVVCRRPVYVGCSVMQRHVYVFGLVPGWNKAAPCLLCVGALASKNRMMDAQKRCCWGNVLAPSQLRLPSSFRAGGARHVAGLACVVLTLKNDVFSRSKDQDGPPPFMSETRRGRPWPRTLLLFPAPQKLGFVPSILHADSTTILAAFLCRFGDRCNIPRAEHVGAFILRPVGIRPSKQRLHAAALHVQCHPCSRGARPHSVLQRCGISEGCSHHLPVRRRPEPPAHRAHPARLCWLHHPDHSLR